MPIPYTPYTMSIVAETTIYQNEIKCHLNENDFNYSQNPTVFKNISFTTGSSAFPYYTPISGSATCGIITDGTLIDAVTGSDFKPYATTIGLFNEAGDLLVVGKLAVPYPIPSHTDLTFVIRYDS